LVVVVVVAVVVVVVLPLLRFMVRRRKERALLLLMLLQQAVDVGSGSRQVELMIHSAAPWQKTSKSQFFQDIFVGLLFVYYGLRNPKTFHLVRLV
jgi:hypothetical protein